ncbi:MAG: hypothetical protein ACPGVD_01615, partial [Flavobacteriales bacterium]
MKKLLLIAILLFAFLSNSKASHVSSADLTYECLGGLSYKFTLKIYRDCSGQSVSNSQVISYSAPSCGLSSGFIMNVDTSYEISQVCDSLLPYTNCNSGSIQGIEVYVYTKTVSLLAYCSDYNFSIAICCRSTALSNLSTTGFNFYTSTTLNNLGGRCNDSPIFKAVPILYTCFSEVVNFNNLAFDVEGDSLSYKLVRTVGGNGINIPYSHVSLSATNPFFTASGILFDSVSGQMSFTSNLIQQVMATVLITEYDTNGNVKGTHMRDLHFIIINCPPPKHNPYTTGVNFDTTNYTYFGCYNEPLFFDVYSVSFDSASPIDLQYFSSIPGATFTTRVSNDTTFGKFSWNPGNRLGDYYFSIQTVAKTCPLKRQNIFNYRINLDTFLHECIDTTIFLPLNGSLTIDSTYVLDVNTSGVCNTDRVLLSKSNFSCNDTGQNIVNVTTYYSNGIIKTCSAIVTVVDSVSPYAACVDTTIYLNSKGEFTIDSTFIHDTTIISCGTISMILDKYNFNCSDLGVNIVSLEVTEGAGLKDTCQAMVTVLDTTKPNPVCKNINVYLDSLGQISIDSASLDNGSTDNCSVASFALSVSDFDCDDIGVNKVWMIVTDISGNKDSCQGMVSVFDTLNPIPYCMDTTIYLNSFGVFTITNSFVNNRVTDNCVVDSIWLSKYNFDCTNIGNDTIRLYVKDGVGNSDSCMAIVHVRDTQSPTAICQNISVYLNQFGTSIIDSSDINNGSFDNCNIRTIRLSDTLFDCSDIGLNMITMTVTDSYGNTGICQATVTVIDTVRPMAICSDTTVYIDSLGIAIINSNYIDNLSSDNCGIDSIWLSQYNFDCMDAGANSISLYVLDSSGNIDSCSSIVTIIDTVNPIANCNDTTIYLSASGTVTIDSSFIHDNTNVGCDIYTIKLDQYNYDCGNIGSNTITMTATDINGNQNSCQSIVTVLDTTKPVAICQNITVYLNALGSVKIDSSDIDNGSTDNCKLHTIKPSDTLFTCSNQGINLITMVVSDSSGNQDSCQATVTVLDTVRPMAICTDTTVYIDSTGLVTITTNFVDNGSTDNCRVDSMWLSKYTFDCHDTGKDTISFYVVDSVGNIDSCHSIITIVDTVNPIASCSDTTIYLSASGTATIDSSFINSNLNYGCDIFTIKLNQYNYDCSDIGLNSISMTVTDINGNQDSCQSIVTVLDTTKPIAICQNITVYLNSFGWVKIDSSDVDNGSNDNCDIRTIKISDTLFDCSNQGINVVTIVVTDYSGNTDSCQAIVTVLDAMQPAALCKDTVLFLNSIGSLVITPIYIDNGSSDNCSLDSLWLSKDTFDCQDTGRNTVTLYVIDSAGNIDSCSAVVTINDTNRPTAICIDTAIYLNGSGSFVIDSSFVNNNSSFVCDISTIKLSQ